MKLIRNCISDMRSRGIHQWSEDYPTGRIFRRDIRGSSLYILEDEGHCLGLVSINEEQSPEYKEVAWLDHSGKVLAIHRLAVDPEWQKQGIGRQLMDFAENQAIEKGYSSIRLDAYSGNPRSLSFYERRGFRKVGQIFFPERELPFFCYEKKLAWSEKGLSSMRTGF